MDLRFQDMLSRMMTLGQRESRESTIAAYDKDLKHTERQCEELKEVESSKLNLNSSQGYKGISQNVKLLPKNRISMSNLELNKVHHGKFLLCRVIRKCIKMTALSTVVEDPEGAAERLSLYNWLQQSAIPVKDRGRMFTTSKFLPIGTILIIKNPYYKIAADFHNFLRSDNPDDIIILDNDNEILKEVKWSTIIENNKAINKKILSADDYRLRGNDRFKSNDFKAAINEYSNGIKLDPKNSTLLANRAEAYLRLNLFKKALNDVEIVLKHDRDHVKAAFRKGKALCGLKRYKEAIITLQSLCQMVKTSNDNNNTLIKKWAEELLKHIEMLNSENQNGHYDFIRIVDEYCEKVKTNKDGDNYNWVHELGPRLDHADYLIDDIEIRHVKKKGRGWVAKRDIPENTLLMVSKAFNVVFSNDVPFSQNIDSSSRKMDITSELITDITQRLTTEQKLCEEVYQLYGGSDLIPIEELDDENLLSVDMKRIEKIVKYNSFELLMRRRQDILINTDEIEDVGIGLWILPSYFNHSCVDTNVSQSFIGDLMFLRSSRPILKNDELTISYCDNMSLYEERSERLKSYDINCQCRLCKLDRSESQKIKIKRTNLIETFENSICPKVDSSIANNHFDPSLIKELKKIIDELQDMRKDYPEFEFQSFKPKTTLALVYSKTGNSHQSLSIMKELYNFLKITNKNFVGDIALKISLCYFELNMIKEFKEWYDVALKEFAQSLKGKFEDSKEIRWREEAIYLAEKLSPDNFWLISKVYDILT